MKNLDVPINYKKEHSDKNIKHVTSISLEKYNREADYIIYR